MEDEPADCAGVCVGGGGVAGERSAREATVMAPKKAPKVMSSTHGADGSPAPPRRDQPARKTPAAAATTVKQRQKRTLQPLPPPACPPARPILQGLRTGLEGRLRPGGHPWQAWLRSIAVAPLLPCGVGDADR